MLYRYFSALSGILNLATKYQNPKKIEQNIEQVKAVILSNEGKEKPVGITEF
jgi:hypothetical protein